MCVDNSKSYIFGGIWPIKWHIRSSCVRKTDWGGADYSAGHRRDDCEVLAYPKRGGLHNHQLLHREDL